MSGQAEDYRAWVETVEGEPSSLSVLSHPSSHHCEGLDPSKAKNHSNINRTPRTHSKVHLSARLWLQWAVL